jgi:hypothetical protein
MAQPVWIIDSAPAWTAAKPLPQTRASTARFGAGRLVTLGLIVANVFTWLSVTATIGV